MATHAVHIELPQHIIDLLGSPEEASAQVMKALVLDLLREAKISQGKAAELLGITRWEMLDLMAKYHIPSGPLTTEELAAEIETVKRYSKKS